METKNENANVLAQIQSEIIAHKDQINNYAGFKYRTAEGILAEVKPVVNKYGFYIKLSDEIKQIGGSLFLESKAELLDNSGQVAISSSAVVLHEEARKGMSPAQLSGATSSYARKYALCGLFGIDDAEQDIDALATHGQNNQSQQAYNVISDEQFQILQEMIDAAGVDIKRFLSAYKCNSLSTFNAAYYDDAIAKLKTKLG